MSPPEPQLPRRGRPATSRTRSFLRFCGGLLLYLVATGIFLRLTWFIPGTGLETLTIRTLLGSWLPGILVLGGLPWLQHRQLQAWAAGLLGGMILVGLGLAGLALGLALGLRVFSS